MKLVRLTIYIISSLLAVFTGILIGYRLFSLDFQESKELPKLDSLTGTVQRLQSITLGQEIWYMQDDKPTKAFIFGIRVKNQKEFVYLVDKGYLDEGYWDFDSRWKTANKLFPSKAALLDSLK